MTRRTGSGHVRGEARAAYLLLTPNLLLLGVFVRRSRPALAAAVVLPPILDHRIGGSYVPDGDVAAPDSSGLVGYAALRLLDDVAYGAGVWAGCISARSWRALLPSFSGPLPPPEPPTDS